MIQHIGPKRFTAGGTAAAGLGGPISLAVMGGAVAAPYVRDAFQSKDNAKRFVDRFEDPFGKELARLSQLAELDPDAAAEGLRIAWNKFYADAQGYIAKGGQDAVVARQALSNPKLIQTVDRLAAQVGIPNVRSNTTGTTRTVSRSTTPTGSSILDQIRGGNVPLSSFTSGGGGRQSGPLLGMDLEDWIRLGVNTIPRSGGGGNSRPSGTSAPTGTTQTGGSLPAEKPKAPPGMDEDEWSWLWDVMVPAGATAGIDLLGSYFTSKAAKEAAQLQVDAANRAADLQAATTREALALQGRMYDEGVARQKPFYDTGNMARGRLSHFMGLEEDPNAQAVPLSTMAGPRRTIQMTPAGPSQYAPVDTPFMDPTQMTAIADQYAQLRRPR